MKILNIHKRIINQPKTSILELFKTLSSQNDLMIDTEKWSPVRLDNGLKIGSKGGHGPIGYFIQRYDPASFIEFKFTKPVGFNGIHTFEITEMENNSTEIKHTIAMTISGKTIFLWTLIIRWLHDAYIEDAFDKVENQFTMIKKQSEWSWWVRFLRRILKPRKVRK